MNVIRNEMEQHFVHWKLNQIDKTTIPLYCVLDGAGSGKSKLLTELKTIAAKSVENKELRKRLQTVNVFNVSFENGTMLDLRIENDPLQAIGTRMLYQLIGEQASWSSFVRKFRTTPDDLID
ncbi:hypothetical protein HK096_001911, partial [Nowakowskiella sp. JEL0078]